MHAHICSMFQHSYAIPKKYCLYSTHNNITIVIKKSFIADKYLLLIYLPFFKAHKCTQCLYMVPSKNNTHLNERISQH